MKPVTEFQFFHPHQGFRCSIRDSKQFSFEWHQHNYFELTYIMNGCGERYVGDRIESYFAGDFVLLPPGLPHTWVSRSQKNSFFHQAVYAHFPKDWMGGDFLGDPDLRSIRTLLDRAERGLIFKGSDAMKIAQSFQLISNKKGFDRFHLFLMTLYQLSQLSKNNKIPIASPLFNVNLGTKYEGRMEKLLKYLHTHFTKSISLIKMLQVSRMSERTFFRVFKQSTGKTWITYLQELRIGRAALLLIETDKTVSEICFESGFSSLPYFNRIFFQIKRTTPTKFRKSWINVSS